MARLHVPAQEPCGASALVHMCCADGHGACCCRSSMRAPCVLAVQPICIFTTAICPSLMNVCSQKHGEMRKMEVKNLRKHVQRRQKKCRDCRHLPHPRSQEPFCSWMRTHPQHRRGDNADFPQCLHLFGHTKPFFISSLSSFSSELPGLIPLTKPRRGPCLSKEKNHSPWRPSLLPSSNTIQS